MARIPDEEIERLKKEVDLAELVVRSGVALKKAGGTWWAVARSTTTTPPRWWSRPAKNLWHCMGACQTGGSAIDWVMRTQGVSFRHAVELLRAGAAPAITTGQARPVATRSRSTSCPPRSTPSAEDQACSPRSSTTTTPPWATRPRRWPTWPAGRSTTPRRSSGSASAMPTAPSATACRASEPRKGAPIRGRLQRLGVLRAIGPRAPHRFVVVPVMRPDGTVTELYGRKVGQHLRAGTPAHLYLPGPHRGVWNEEGSTGGEVIVTESLIDALTLLLRRVPQRHRLLRHRRVHRRSPPRPSSATRWPGCSSPTTTTPPATSAARHVGRRPDGRRRRVLPGRVPLRHRRQRRGRGADHTGRRARALCAGRRVDGAGTTTTRRQARPVGKVTTSDPKVTLAARS